MEIQPTTNLDGLYEPTTSTDGSDDKVPQRQNLPTRDSDALSAGLSEMIYA